jgi:DNA-binding MarR family transcriptional regulator
LKAFIPSWLDQAQLSQADFRVYCHLASRADNRTGIAWPQAESIARDCCMAKNTVWKSLKSLEAGKFIRRVGKPFAGSNRYQVLVPIGANEIPNEEPPIGANEIPIGDESNRRKLDTPIGANQILQSAQMDSRECNPKKVIQRRVSNKGDLIELPFSSESFKEAWTDWQQHRREIKKKLTPTSTKQQFKELSQMGEAAAIEAIHHSIGKGWQGIFPPSSANGSKPLKSHECRL